jgi:hypothetical protein
VKPIAAVEPHSRSSSSAVFTFVFLPAPSG